MSDWLSDHLAAENARRQAALVDGRHYSSYAAEVKALLKARDDDAAAGVLARLIAAIEREAEFPLAGHSVVPRWYFDQLAKLYDRAGMHAERGLLMQRYTTLAVHAETQSLILMRRMKKAIPATKPAARRSALPTSTKRAHSAGKVAGEAAGKLIRGLFGALLRTKR